MSDPISSAAPGHNSSPVSAEDRKAAAALSSLNTTEMGTETALKQPSSAEQEALGKAMSRLEAAAGQRPTAGKLKAQTDSEMAKKAVKVASEDVSLLVGHLDLSKIKATELLKANEGDVKRAIRAFIVAS